jgi:hypothetical protein
MAGAPPYAPHDINFRLQFDSVYVAEVSVNFLDLTSTTVPKLINGWTCLFGNMPVAL